ncbi:hypothetical protein [Marinomonas colpomeniae]|uniref:Uncharacterized protein n=1 Tax=Marinomonas colpomeniae TaxID=2774408 RepID=A0ABR8P353_9GAMM|nr:hypothetical protein [Marinomonas colpomeniae]MBD5772718.1 hypothetical protein [Marinomonas colpomeniae]
MFRELTSKQAFQTHCLTQIGVVSWLSVSESSQAGITGTVFMPPQPWVVGTGLPAGSDIATKNDSGITLPDAPILGSPKMDVETAGFDVAIPKPVAKMLPEEKEQSVSGLREQLNAGPEIIVEDLQPIEELAVDIIVEPDPSIVSQITRLDIRAYSLSNKLLILSDVPQVFSQEEEVERLALKMGQALLKQSIDEWQSSAFSWPGGLKNPYFIKRADWLFGALESYVDRLVKDFPETPLLVLAGDQVAQLMDDLPAESLLKQYPTARIVSLSELHRIPELRKDAWEVMQSCLFNSNS